MIRAPVPLDDGAGAPPSSARRRCVNTAPAKIEAGLGGGQRTGARPRSGSSCTWGVSPRRRTCAIQRRIGRGRSGMTWRGAGIGSRGGQDLGEPEGVDAPPIARVKPGRPWVDEREPAAGPRCRPPRTPGPGPARSPPGTPQQARRQSCRLVRAQDQREVDGPVGDGGEADGDRAPGAATPAALGHEVTRQPRTEQSGGVDIDRRRASDGRGSALELVDRQIDAVRAESSQGLLEAVPPDEPLEVSDLTARQPK